MAESKQYVEVTPGEVAAAVASAECIHCRGRKRAGEFFCRTDLLALPLYLRQWLGRGPSDGYFVENFRRALQHLIDIGPQRKRRLDGLGRAVSWPYRTPDELAAAGFVFERSGDCRGCAARIAWLRTPEGGWIALNVGTWQPHSTTCPNPDAYRRPLQTSAARRARRTR